jgi:hypothetical protein
MWRRVGLMLTDVSEKRSASIFYPEDGDDTFFRNAGRFTHDLHDATSQKMAFFIKQTVFGG